jgi:hypothetical protein
MESKCNKEICALGVFWYCGLKEGMTVQCRGEMDDLSFDQVRENPSMRRCTSEEITH